MLAFLAIGGARLIQVAEVVGAQVEPEEVPGSFAGGLMAGVLMVVTVSSVEIKVGKFLISGKGGLQALLASAQP